MALVVVQTSAKAAPNPPSNVVIFGVELDMDTKFPQLPLSRNVNVSVDCTFIQRRVTSISTALCLLSNG